MFPDDDPLPGTLTIAVAVPVPDPVSTTELGLTVHVAGEGTKQLSVTDWANPFTGVRVMVLLAWLPRDTVTAVAVTLKSGFEPLGVPEPLPIPVN